MDVRRRAARLAYRLGLASLGRRLWPSPGIEPLDVAAIVRQYRWPVNGGHFPVSDAGLLDNDSHRVAHR